MPDFQDIVDLLYFKNCLNGKTENSNKVVFFKLNFIQEKEDSR